MAVIFKIATRSQLQRGADLRWVSAFPAEMEYLYPPLVYLAPTGRAQTYRLRLSPGTRKGGSVVHAEVTVIEMEPQL